MRRSVTFSGAANVMPRARHSSTSNFRLFELVFDEFEQGRAGEIGDRENGFEDGLQPFVGAPAFGFVDEEELIVRGFLDLDQVGHFGDFADVTEKLADPFPACERLRHVAPRTFRAADTDQARRPITAAREPPVESGTSSSNSAKPRAADPFGRGEAIPVYSRNLGSAWKSVVAGPQPVYSRIRRIETPERSRGSSPGPIMSDGTREACRAKMHRQLT